MPISEDIGHSMLIVSSHDAFAVFVRKSLKGFLSVDVQKSAASARRMIMERYYDIIVVNAPLPDETGEDFVLDAAREGSASVLFVVPSEVYETALERLTDFGILVLSKPLQQGNLDKSIRFLVSIQNRMREYEKQLRLAREKSEETRIITKAKFLLMEKQHMTEDEAHRAIGRQAMNNGVSRKRIAQRILEDFE